MIISKTPFRMSFFGGGTDFDDYFNQYGGSVLSTTFDKYCYVSVRHLPHFFDFSSQIIYSKVENVKDVDEIIHPAVRNAMEYLDMKDIHLVYDSDLPARSGLGTSSSFAVGMLNAFYALKGKYVDKRKLADDAIYVERVLCDEEGGMQDQIAAAFGGLNRIDFSKEGYSVSPIIINNERKQQLNRRLMLFFTGISRFSSDIADEQRRNIENKKYELDQMKELVFEAEKILEDKRRSLDEFGVLLDRSWQLKRNLAGSISNPVVDDIYERGQRAGALGGKLLGAGGGGFILFYCPEEKQKRLSDEMKGLLQIPFQFENEGTKILYFFPEELTEG